MKELLISYVQYNIWANNYIIKQLLALTDAHLDTEQQGSFTSIRKTAYHIWMAESIWSQRLALVETPIAEALTYTSDFKMAMQKWQDSSAALLTFVTKQKSDEAFTHEMIYVDLKKQSHKNKVYQTLQHVCNHSTFHRGQIINYLRAVGVTKIESTDYIHWCRTVRKK